MSRLFIITYGDQAGSNDILKQFINIHDINHNDVIFVIASFDSDVLTASADIQTHKRRIQNQIITTAKTTGLTIAFNGPQVNAYLEYVSQADMQGVYSRVYAILSQLLETPFANCICTYGDAHPQVMLATVNACLRTSKISLAYLQNNHSHIVTSVGAPVGGLGILQPELPTRLRVNYKSSTNIYLDMHVFIEKMNSLLDIREYAAVNSSIVAEYLHNTSVPPQVSQLVTKQWSPLAYAMKSWNDFNHEEAYNNFERILTTITTLISSRTAHITNKIEQDELDKMNYLKKLIKWYMARLYHIVIHKQAFNNVDKFNKKPDRASIDEVLTLLRKYNTDNQLNGYELAIDKYMNALRVMDQKRFDDAIVRLNSVLEDLARIRLFIKWGIVVNNMRQMELNALLGKTDGPAYNIVNVSRRDLYSILRSKDAKDALWIQYEALGGNKYHNSRLEEAVNARHKSYLVHGNNVISPKDCKEYADVVKLLIEAAVGDAIDFSNYDMPDIQLKVDFYPHSDGILRELAIDIFQP